MDKNYHLNPGDLMIRSTDEYFTFRAGNEFDPVIWICSDVLEEKIIEYNDFGEREVIGTIPNFNPIDIFTGKKSLYGLHMFMTYEEFMNDYRRIRLFMKQDENYRLKLTYDEADSGHLHFADDHHRIQIINAVIHQVRLFFAGIESGDIVSPTSVNQFLSNEDITTNKLLHTIAELEMFSFPTPSEIERIKLEKNKNEN